MNININDIAKQFSVTIYGTLEEYNEVLSKARVRIFYKYGNRNGTYITDEFADELIKTIPYTPIKGIYDSEEQDYTDHGEKRSLGRIYGIVPENPNLTWEKHQDEDGIEREYACADVLLFTAIYKEAGEIIGQAQSMELYDKTIEGAWQFVEGKRYFVFSKGCFLGLQVLGEEVEPCFEGAAFFTLYESITNMLNKIEQFNLNNQQGGTEVPKLTFKLSDSTKHDILFRLLNPNYTEQGGWTVENGICDVYDDYAIVRNYEAGSFERVYYTKDDTTDSLTIDKKEVCFIVDVTESEKTTLDTLQKLNKGSFDKVDEVYSASVNLEAEKASLELKIGELNTSISTLTTERDEAKTEYEQANTLLGEAQASLEEAQTTLNSLKEENSALASYKAEVEKAEKTEILTSYSGILSEKILAVYTEKIGDYTATELDKELAYELKKTNPSVFSKAPQSQYVPKDDASKDDLAEILSKYEKN